jgi:hypothetical protein
MNVQFTAAAYLEMFLGQNRIESLLQARDVRPPTTRDDSAAVTASCIIGPYFFDGTVSVVTCVQRGIVLYRRQATVGLYSITGIISARQCCSTFHPDCVNSSVNH